MGHEILPVTHIAQVIESVQQVSFEVEQGLGLVVHAEPKHPRHVVAAEKPRAVKVHFEGLVVLGHFLARLDNGWDVFNGRATEEFQCEVYLIGFHIVDITLMLKVFLQFFNECRKFSPARDGNGQEGAFGVHNG